LPIVFALAGDSTITSEFPRPVAFDFVAFAFAITVALCKAPGPPPIRHAVNRFYRDSY